MWVTQAPEVTDSTLGLVFLKPLKIILQSFLYLIKLVVNDVKIFLLTFV